MHDSATTVLMRCKMAGIIGASLSEPHLVRSVAGSANRMCLTSTSPAQI